MVHDPVVAETVRSADHLEPRFVLDEQEARRRPAAGRVPRVRRASRPNVLVILFDDVGWGDFGCYGGGVAVGAPTPNIDKLARRGPAADVAATREPSCTPSRASLMTGRLPMRHGLLRPPMYGQPGGLDGEVTLAAAAVATRATSPRPSASGTWARTRESQPQHVGFDDFYGFLSVSDMYTEWRDPNFFPEIVYSEERTRVGREPAVQQVLRARDARRRARERRRGHDPGPVAARRQVGRLLARLHPAHGRQATTQPWFLYHCTRGAHFDNYPHERFLGSSPAKHPYKDTIIELDDIVGRLVAELEATGQLDDTLIFLSSDNGPEMETWPDAAYSPFRCAKGSTWEGGQRVPGIVAWPGMIAADRASDGLFSQMDLFNTLLRARRRRAIASRRSLHRRRRPDVVPARTPTGESNRKFLYYWLVNVFSALRVGEWKFMVALDLRRRPRRA